MTYSFKAKFYILYKVSLGGRKNISIMSSPCRSESFFELEFWH